MRNGKSLSIYLHDGTTQGIRLAEVMNWTGQAVMAPREKVKELAGWGEVSRAGVYVLFGDSLDADLPLAYIGEAEDVFDRLKGHLAQKDFWTEVVILTSKDDSVTKAHAKYLESRFITLAKDAKRYQLENGNAPSLPSLQRGHIDAMEEFIDQAQLLLGTLGHPLLKPLVARSAGTPPDRDGILTFNTKDAVATGMPSSGSFVVLSGSYASRRDIHEGSGHLQRVRDELIEQGILSADGDRYRFTQDHLFSSPSRAAAIVAGSSQNGRLAWRDRQGRTLKDIEEAQPTTVGE